MAVVALVLWLIVSRDEQGQLNEYFLLMIILAWALWQTFGLVVVAMFPPEQR